MISDVKDLRTKRLNHRISHRIETMSPVNHGSRCCFSSDYAHQYHGSKSKSTPQGFDSNVHERALDKLHRDIADLKRKRAANITLRLPVSHRKHKMSLHKTHSGSNSASKQVTVSRNIRSECDVQVSKLCIGKMLPVSKHRADCIARLTAPRTLESKFKRYLTKVKNVAEGDVHKVSSQNKPHGHQIKHPSREGRLLPYTNELTWIPLTRAQRKSPETQSLLIAIQTVIGRIAAFTRRDCLDQAETRRASAKTPLNVSNVPSLRDNVSVSLDGGSSLSLQEVIRYHAQIRPTRVNLLRLCSFLKLIERSQVT